MTPPTANDYLLQRVQTASSAQLHLMLIEGAIRFATQADRFFEANDASGAAQPLMRSMDIVSEMLAGVKHSDDDVNVKLAALYQFVFTRLTMAYVNTDRAKLAESIKILEYERETWRQACQSAAGADADQQPGPEAAGKKADLKGPHKPAPIASESAPIEGGLSLEA